MATYGRDVFGILVKIDVYQREFHATVPIAVYFGNRTNRVDRMYHAAAKMVSKKQHKSQLD